MPIAAALETLVLKAFNEDFVFSFPEELSLYVNFGKKFKFRCYLTCSCHNIVANPSQKKENVTNLRTVCDIMNSIESS